MTINTLITLENIQNTVSLETGIRLKNNDFFLHKLFDGFSQNAWALKTPEKQKNAIYAMCSHLAKCKAAGVDFVQDFDLITPIFRGGVPSITIDTKLMVRLLRKKGYFYQERLIPIAKGGKGRFEEQIVSGRRIEVWNGHGDEEPIINVANMVDGTIEQFAMRISVGKDPMQLIDFVTYVPTPEVIAASNAGEMGIYEKTTERRQNKKGEWYDAKCIKRDADGNPVVSKMESPWHTFTSEMVAKTVRRRLQKIISEAFPDIAVVMDVATAADEPTPVEHDADTDAVPVQTVDDKSVDVPADEEFDFDNLTDAQFEEAKQASQSYVSVKGLLLQTLESLYKELPDTPEDEAARYALRQKVLRKHFATLVVAKRAFEKKDSPLMQKFPQLYDALKWLWEKKTKK